MSELDCPRSDEAAAYVLGALEDAEVERFRRHLTECARCRQEVSELQPTVDRLATSAPATAAPAHLHDRVMAVVTSEAELLAAAGHEADRPPRARRRSFRLGPAGALATAAALAAGVVIGLAASSGTSTHVTHAVMASSAPPGATAMLRQTDGRADLEVSHMTQAPNGRVYEVWVQRGTAAPQATDALFVVDHSGDASVSIPGGVHGVRRVMVTNEPVGGSSAPTTEPVITVPL